MADSSLGGVWRLYTPHRLNVSFPDGFSYGRVVMHLCRIVQRGQTVSGNCLLDKVTPLAGTASGDRFNLTLNGIGFAGQIIGWNRIRGDLGLHVLGLGVTPPIPAGGERVVRAARTAPDPGTESALRAAIADALSGRRLVRRDLPGQPGPARQRRPHGRIRRRFRQGQPPLRHRAGFGQPNQSFCLRVTRGRRQEQKSFLLLFL